jgi:hypothetical protein
MTLKKLAIPFWITTSLLYIGLLLGLVLPPAPVQADVELPPRDQQPTPTPVRDEEDDDGPAGAHLVLHVPDAAPGVWAVVQWQDSTGGWHTVEGWQGALEAEGRHTWWVAAKDFGTGPFRWLLTRGQGGETLGVSQAFHLPGQAGHTLEVSLPAGE